jgi:rhodanese-related sulfurtransferase
MQTIGIRELIRHVDVDDVFVLDVRAKAHSAQIYGALRYDPGQLCRADELTMPFPRGDGLIVLYDQGGGSKHLRDLAHKFEAAGYGAIRTLEGGFEAWKAEGGRCQAPSLERPVPGVTGHQVIR